MSYLEQDLIGFKVTLFGGLRLNSLSRSRAFEDGKFDGHYGCFDEANMSLSEERGEVNEKTQPGERSFYILLSKIMTHELYVR